MCITALIMAGGSGQRFWPLSTEDRPKQLLSLFSEKSMIRETVDRILPILPAEHIYIATNIKQSDAIQKELPFIPRENIILEPAFKDTAAAIGFGSLFIKFRHTGAEVIVLAADHLIQDPFNFRSTLIKACEEAKLNQSIVTLGILPTKPETGYGYIKVSGNVQVGEPTVIEQFCEKPDSEKARGYVASKQYLWNSGLFIFSIETILTEIKMYMTKHYRVLLEINEWIQLGLIGEELAQAVAPLFNKFEKVSIDYGVMEHSKRIKVIPSDFGWNDIGSFTAFEDIYEANGNGTVVRHARIKEHNSRNNIIIGNGLEIATIGIEDVVIIQTEDKLLICRKDQVQDIKKILA